MRRLRASRAALMDHSSWCMGEPTLEEFSSYFTLLIAEREAKTLEMVLMDGRLGIFFGSGEVSLLTAEDSGSYV